jgi:protein gp37
MAKSAIEWTEATWNPIVGCSIVSPGCTNCYAMKMAARIEAMGNQPRYAGTTRKVNGNVVWTGKLAQAPESTLLEPLKRKKPTMYFVNSMGDLFHEDVPDEWIDKVFAVMALAPQHTFQVLTKRAKRMLRYFDPAPEKLHTRWLLAARDMLGSDAKGVINGLWPLPNVWLGVSTERQQEADERIPELLKTPAAVRFISAEPLLGPIDLTSWIMDGCEQCDDGAMGAEPHCHRDDIPRAEQCPEKFAVFSETEGPVDEDGAPAWIRTDRVKLDWVIVGGESGREARAMHPAWARSLRDQCAAAGVRYFFKQWGEHLPWSQFNGAALEDDPEQTRFATYEWEDGRWNNVGRPMWCDSVDDNIDDENCVARVGKKKAGRLLDGKLHDEMPQRRL